jgi:Spy/CpxP family protein refolding chaperone
MSKRISAVWMMVLLTMIPLSSSAQSGGKPYAGQEKREIKALSADEILGYLNGEGMGLAKAAELNHYPGPRHVLDMASQLQLSEAQVAETQEIYDRMHEGAVDLGEMLVHRERELDRLFARNEIDPDRLGAVLRDIAGLQGELRAVHLHAHLKMRRILSPDQIERYDELRGYKASGGGGLHGNHEHGAHGNRMK